jgi:hypothetical protein
MGYESKMFIVEKRKHSSWSMTITNPAIFWAEDMVCFDLRTIGNYGPFYELFNGTNKKETSHYIYPDDGNTEILKDYHDKPLTEATIPETIAAIEADIGSNKEYVYRRLPPFIALLKGFIPDEWQNLAVLHYGH